MAEIFSLGHSTLDYPQFLLRLREFGISAIADVRSSPYSRAFAHFNREAIKASLAIDQIAYVFLGKELGGRPQGIDQYTDGVADYEKMANVPTYDLGLKRLEKGALEYRIAMMCSEHSPFDCHRCLLVGRSLSERGHLVNHITSSGDLRSQVEIEEELLLMADKFHEDMFLPRSERLADAYRARARRVAYSPVEKIPDREEDYLYE